MVDNIVEDNRNQTIEKPVIYESELSKKILHKNHK